PHPRRRAGGHTGGPRAGLAVARREPGGHLPAGDLPARRARADHRLGAGLHRLLHLLCHAADPRRRAADDDGDLPLSARDGHLRLGRRLDDRRGDDPRHLRRGDRDEQAGPPPQPGGGRMTTRTSPVLVAIAALIFLFLVAPLVIIVGASLSDTTYLAFPPRGLTLRWFWNIFEIEAFRSTAITSFQLAV